jgi:hypothetical protein
MKIKLYLDIDGVLLRSDQKGELKLIPNVKEFLEYTRKHYKCFWLSTHSRYSAEDVRKYLAPYFKKAGLNLELIGHIKALRWKTLKTEAIDFSSHFIWIDDAPLPSEIEVLREKRCEKSLLIVNEEKDLLNRLIPSSVPNAGKS